MNRPIPALLIATALGACGGGSASKTPAQAKPTAEAVKKVPAKEEAVAQPQTQVEYAYSPVGKRDPFRSILDEVNEVRPGELGRPGCGPLCKWEIEQLKLVAVISGMSNPLGMVE